MGLEILMKSGIQKKLKYIQIQPPANKIYKYGQALPATITIFDMQSKTIKIMSLKQSLSVIDLNGLTQGIYETKKNLPISPCKTNRAVGSNLTMGKRNKHINGLTRQCKEE